MSDPRPEYLIDAEEITGKGYPSVSIEPPRKVTERNGGELEEKSIPAWIKFSTAFKEELKDIPGVALKVWIYIALSVNYNGTAFPGIRTIAKAVNLSHQTVIDAIAKLEELNLLSVRRGERRYNLYDVSNDYVTIGRGNEPVKNLDRSDGMSQENGPMSQVLPPNESTPLDSNKKEQEDNKRKGTSPKKELPPGSDPSWLIAAGATSEEVHTAAHSGDAVEAVLLKFDIGLKCNLPRTGAWQDFAKWAARQTSPTIDAWLEWYRSDKFRANNGWRMTPEKIKMSWPAAITDASAAIPTDGGGLYV